MFVSCIYPGLVRTGMCLGIVQKFETLTPSMPTQMVSDKMFDMLSLKRSSSELLPFYCKFMPAFIMLKTELNDWFHNFSGANADMAKFKELWMARTEKHFN